MTLAWASPGLFGLGGCTRPAEAPVYRIGFSQCGTEGPWRQAMEAGIRRELSFHPEAQVLMLNAHSDSELQIRQIRQLVQDGVDLLLISPNKAAPLTPVVAEAYARGIPVVLLDRRITSQQYTAYVGASNKKVGQAAAHYAARLLHQRGRVIEVLGTPGSSATADRHLGFTQTLARYPGLQLAGQVTGDWRENSLKPALATLLRAQPAVELIFAHNDGMARGAAEVCQALGRPQVRIIGVDGLNGAGEGLELVQSRRISASLLYPPGGEEAVRVALQILRHQPYQRENELATMVIDSTNAVTMQQQTEKMQLQQREIEQQQGLLTYLRATYASQQTALYVALASLLGAVVLGSVAWRSSRRNRLISQQLALQNQEIRTQQNQLEQYAAQARTDAEAKVRFFTNFSHELRTPLTLIHGPVEELLTSRGLTPAQLQDLGLVRRNTQRLLQLVNQLLDFRKIEVGKMAVRATRGDLVSFVRDIAAAFARAARVRGVELRVLSSEPELPAWFDGNVLDKVFFNLLSNALKFTPDHGVITVSLRSLDDGQNLQVDVSDSGPGISEPDKAHIFEWFYQGDQGAVAKGSGMGLALAQGLVRLHQGQLSFSSQPGQDSTFVVTLPRELPAELRSIEPAAPTLLTVDEPEALATDFGPDADSVTADNGSETLVLVIEDNPEVNSFLARKLRQDFRVQTATDGHSGFRLATDLIPDLIVCDVMMPGLSGLEVVTQLRSDWRTSHIPVVLLTARNAPEQQVEGVQAGADLYLTKPFNPTFLLESVRTLLANRARQREHFRRELSVEKAVPTTSAEHQFLQELTAIVEANLTTTDLSADDIARRLGVSRLQLYRKVKAVLGTGVSDFVKSLRLTKARELLLDESLTIAQVAQALGFSSPSYFTASFRSHYQLTPSEFRALHATPTA